MTTYALINNDGSVAHTVTPGNDDDVAAGKFGPVDRLQPVPPGVSDLRYVVERMYFHSVDGWRHRLPAPSGHHRWSGETWVVDLDGIRASLVEAVRREMDTRIYAPIAYQGAVFDADALSRERITRVMYRLERGDGLPPGWRGWRDGENNMHWADSTEESAWSELRGLATVIENREQAVLLAAWIHKDTLGGLTDVDALLMYDTTADWPSD